MSDEAYRMIAQVQQKVNSITSNPPHANPSSWSTELMQNNFQYNRLDAGITSLALPSSNIIYQSDQPVLLLALQVKLTGTLDAKNATISIFDAYNGPASMLGDFTPASLAASGMTDSGAGVAHLLVADDTTKTYAISYTAQVSPIPFHSLGVNVVMPSISLDTPTTATAALTGVIIKPREIKDVLDNYLPLTGGRRSAY